VREGSNVMKLSRTKRGAYVVHVGRSAVVGKVKAFEVGHDRLIAEKRPGGFSGYGNRWAWSCGPTTHERRRERSS
jgi:hypothetical protein